MAGCGDNAPKYDYSHVSKHFIKGTYEHAITQKGKVGDATFQIHTDVNKDGNVGPSDFGNFNILKKK